MVLNILSFVLVLYDSSGKLDSVLKWALAVLVIYKSISIIRKLFSRPAHTGHTRSGDPAHNGTSRILDTKITAGLESTNQNDSAEGNSILDTKITAGVELTDQNDSAEGSISGTLV